MKAFGVLVFVGLVALINAQSTTRVPLENIDVDNTLKNEKLINKYVACVKQTPGARCPKDAQELKGDGRFGASLRLVFFWCDTSLTDRLSSAAAAQI